MTTAFLELTLIVLTAATLGFIARLLRQPVILAYILTGVLVAIFQFSYPIDKEFFRVFSQLGVMFLLFLIGLEIDYASLRLVGRTSLIAGIAQIIFTFVIGFLIAVMFGIGYLASAYISIALTFSSTIIVVKLLSQKKDLRSLYGKITVGFLLVQDFLAILILVMLSGIGANKEISIGPLLIAILKGAALTAIMFYLGRKIMPLVFDKIARSEEMLFLGTLAWCLGIAAASLKAGFSIEIGGFLAGLALANTSERFSISDRVRPLQDFFILIFFVMLGSSLALSNLSGILWPIIIFSLFVLIGNPVIVLIIMGLMGYKRRTGFLCGVSVAQISEFSLILAALGFSLGHITGQEVSLITAVGIITITLSSYMIIWNEELFRFMSSYLKIFERRISREENELPKEFDKPIILIGSHRVGQNIAASLPKKDLLIIDFDPDIISQMRKQGYVCLYGDIADAMVAEKSNLKNARLLISTSPDFEDNLRILSELGNLPKRPATSEARPDGRPKIILRAEDERDAALFYKKGADYVILPHFTAGQYLGRSIEIDPELKILEQLRKKDLEIMKKLEIRDER